MDLIERYVQEVGRALPRGDRTGIERELRSLLQDSLESRTEDREGAEDEVQIELLREFGPPSEMAHSYAPRARWLVGPRYFDAFGTVVRICAVVALIAWVQAVVGSAEWSEGWLGVLRSTGHFWFHILQGWLMLVGFLALAFAVLERTLKGPFSERKEWDPRRLPPVAGPDYASRTATAVRGALALCALALVNVFPGTIGGAFVSIGEESGFAPLLGPGMAAAVLPLNAVLLIELAVTWALLQTVRWSLPTRITMRNRKRLRHGRSIVRGPFKWFAMLPFLLPFAACSEAQRNSTRAETFDQIWEQINSDFYDETFGGRDWQAIGAEYREQALTAPTERDFYVTLNTMLFRLDVSHIGVIPNEHPEWIGVPSIFPDGEVGLTVRIIEDRIVVTRRKAELGDTAPAIQPGTVLIRLNGLTLDDFMAEVTTPPVPAIPPLMLATERAGRELLRDAGETVELIYLNDEGAEASATLTAFPRDGAVQLVEGIPPVYLDFESRATDEQIGYIRFSSFHPELTDRILAALTEFHELPGLIIDLRGNVGGDFNVRRAIAEHLITERALVWRYVNRFGTDDIVLEPAPSGYRGQVVFLVDEMSASAAEELSGAMQALGRAKVVGNKTAGLVLVAGVQPLEIGATLVYPSAETRFVNGSVPEGRGITPDLEVPYDTSALRAGIDPQLMAAIRMLRE